MKLALKRVERKRIKVSRWPSQNFLVTKKNADKRCSGLSCAQPTFIWQFPLVSKNFLVMNSAWEREVCGWEGATWADLRERKGAQPAILLAQQEFLVEE